MKIKNGIEAFTSSVYPQMRENFDKLATGQAPDTLFITCSDSRISPNLLTQTEPGELFVIRNAGNIVPKPGCGELSVEATVLYAVDVLKVKDIVVCGHSHCGAVTGLCNLDSLESMPEIREWVKRSEKILDEIGDGEDRITKAIDANVMLQLDHLREYSSVQAAIDSGHLDLHGWVYEFESGKVRFLTDGNLDD